MFKKINKFKIAIISFIIVGVLISTIAMCAFAAQAASEHQERDGVMVYRLGYDEFQNFIKHPSLEVLEQESNAICVFTKLDTPTGLMQWKMINTDPVRVETSAVLRIGTLSVYSTFLDFVGSKEVLQEFLVENGIAGEVESAIIFEMQRMPVTIWAKMEQEDFFITVNEKFDDYSHSNPSEYVYRLYSYLDYYDKFGIKDGKLFINGKDITEGNYVKVHYSGAYIPFRAIMENLGAKIDWDTENNEALLNCNGKGYILETETFSLVEVGTSVNILILPPGGYYYCQIINDRIIMNDQAMQTIIRLMEAKINVNYDELAININN